MFAGKTFSCEMSTIGICNKEVAMLKPVSLLSTLILCASIAALTPGIMAQQPAAGAKISAPPNPESQVHARKIYARDCAMCHGDNGNGQTDMARDMNLTLKDFADPKTLADKQDRDLFLLIRKGSGKMLPDDEDRVKDDEVRGLIVYIRSFSKSQAAASLSPAR
jgi:mono/diheme cytochrome c family protein